MLTDTGQALTRPNFNLIGKRKNYLSKRLSFKCSLYNEHKERSLYAATCTLCSTGGIDHNHRLPLLGTDAKKDNINIDFISSKG